MRYLLSVLLVAFVAVQAYPSSYSKDQILENNSRDWSAFTKNLPGFPSDEIDEMIKKLQQFIDELKEYYLRFGEEFSELFQKIEEKIEEIASIETVDEIIKIIINDLDNTAAEAGFEIDPKCLTSQMETIKKIATENRNAALKCANDAKGKAKQIQQDALKVQTDVKNLVMETVENAMVCVMESSTAIECLQAVLDNAASKSKVLRTQGQVVMSSAKTMLEDLNQCQQNIKDNFFGSIDKVFEEIKECNRRD